MTVVAAALVGVLLCLAVGGLAVTSAAETARRAAQSADLASLAGAIELRDSADPARACRAAARIAAANRASLVSCSSSGHSAVTVRSAARSRWALAGMGRTAERSARAGPQEPG